MRFQLKRRGSQPSRLCNTPLVRRLAVAIAVALVALPGAAAVGAPPAKTSASGTITALRVHSITVHGGRDVTCRIRAGSLRTRGFAVGMRATIRCVDGVLVLLKKMPAAKQVTTTPTTLGVYVVLGGRITTLSPTSVTVGGSVTCRIGPNSPKVSDFHVGSPVTGRCDGGVLTALSHAGGS